MPRKKAVDLLMWVGAAHYPTVTSFTREASKMGVSKRVAQVPVGVQLGKSLLFLAHDEAARVPCRSCKGKGVLKGKLQIELVKKVGRRWEPVTRPSKKGPVAIRQQVATAAKFRTLRDDEYHFSERKHKWRVVPGQRMCPDCAGRGELPDGRVFGFCVIERLELVFDCPGAATEYKDRMDAKGVRDRVPVTYVSGADKEPRRGCGYRKIGGYYLVASSEDARQQAQELVRGLGTGFGAHGPLIVFPEPVTYPESRFRAAKVVDGAKIMKAAKGARRTRKRVSRPRSNARK